MTLISTTFYFPSMGPYTKIGVWNESPCRVKSTRTHCLFFAQRWLQIFGAQPVCCIFFELHEPVGLVLSVKTEPATFCVWEQMDGRAVSNRIGFIIENKIKKNLFTNRKPSVLHVGTNIQKDLSLQLMHLNVLCCNEEPQSRTRGLKRECGVSDGFFVSAGALSRACEGRIFGTSAFVEVKRTENGLWAYQSSPWTETGVRHPLRTGAVLLFSLFCRV